MQKPCPGWPSSRAIPGRRKSFGDNPPACTIASTGWPCPQDVAKPGLTIRAEVKGNAITVDAPDLTRLTLRLHDCLVDLDKPIRVRLNNEDVFEGTVPRQANAILKSLRERSDPRSAGNGSIGSCPIEEPEQGPAAKPALQPSMRVVAKYLINRDRESD